MRVASSRAAVVAALVAWAWMAVALPALGAERLTGAGATFPYPLYSRYFEEYRRLTGVQVNYQSIGSGGGQRQLLERTVHFGASDAYLSEEQMAQYPGEVVHVPTAVGAVVPTYNLPGVTQRLRFTGELLADIFLGRVTRWDDPDIRALNPDVALPPLPIVVVHRADGSGTTFIWVSYLARVSEEWRQRVGVGTSVEWPVGLGGRGNEGVAGLVRQTPGALGYVELIYALENDLAYGAVRNRSGRYVVPDLASASRAAAVDIPADTRLLLVNTQAPDGYPIAGFTWILVYRDLSLVTDRREQARALAELLWWMVHDAQRYNEPLHYGRLPEPAVQRAEALIRSLTFRGEPLLP